MPETVAAASVLAFDAEAHVYTYQGAVVPSVTQVLADVGIIDTTWYTEEARLRGEYVHKACEFYDQGDLDLGRLDPILRPYVDAYIRFRQESSFQPILIEHRVWNPYHRYAGTLDRVGKLFGGSALIDLKSGTLPAWTALQTAGYLEALEPAAMALRYGLQLKSDGSYRLQAYTDWRDRDLFLSAVNLYHWKRGT